MINPEARALVAKINKEQGEGTVVLASDMKIAKRFTTGSLGFDIALGGNAEMAGWAGNQWHEVIGMESHGKTASIYKTIAANQSVNPDFTTFWVAAEHYDHDQAAALGVNNDQVIVMSTQHMEDAFQKMIEAADSRAIDCIILDSYPALTPNEEDSKDMDENSMTLGARRFGQFFRKVGPATKRSLINDELPILGIIINQYRDLVGGYSPQGTPKTTPGGKGKNFAYITRVDVRRDEWIKEKRPGQGDVIVGQVIKFKTIKNKSAASQQVASVDFYFRDAPTLGFKRGDYDLFKEAVTLAILYNVIKRRGAYYDFKGRTWQGKDTMLRDLRAEPELYQELRESVLAVAFLDNVEQKTEEELDAANSSGKRRVSRRSTEGPDE